MEATTRAILLKANNTGNSRTTSMARDILPTLKDRAPMVHLPMIPISSPPSKATVLPNKVTTSRATMRTATPLPTPLLQFNTNSQDTMILISSTHLNTSSKATTILSRDMVRHSMANLVRQVAPRMVTVALGQPSSEALAAHSSETNSAVERWELLEDWSLARSVQMC